MIPNSTFETWWNAKGFDPNHPLRQRLQKFSDVGADLDIVFTLCCMLAVMNAVHRQMIEVKRQLADGKRRWTKEFRGLCSSHPGGELRLTEVARFYTISVIRSTVDLLATKGLIDSAPIIEAGDVAQIKQQALESFTKMRGFPEDWNAAINETGPAASDLLAAVGFARVTPEQGEWVKKLTSYFWSSVSENKGTKRRDDAGTIFLLFVTEHLRKATRKTTKKGKPHFRLAFNLMRALQDKDSRKISHVRQSAQTRVNKLKRQWPQWQAEMKRFEQMVQSAKIN